MANKAKLNVEETTIKTPIVLETTGKIMEVLWSISGIKFSKIWPDDWVERGLEYELDSIRYYSNWTNCILAYDLENSEFYLNSGSVEKTFYKLLWEIKKQKKIENDKTIFYNKIVNLTDTYNNNNFVYPDKKEETKRFLNNFHVYINKFIDKSSLRDKEWIKKYYTESLEIFSKLMMLDLKIDNLINDFQEITKMVFLRNDEKLFIWAYNKEINILFFYCEKFILTWNKYLDYYKRKNKYEKNHLEKLIKDINS